MTATGWQLGIMGRGETTHYTVDMAHARVYTVVIQDEVRTMKVPQYARDEFASGARIVTSQQNPRYNCMSSKWETWRLVKTLYAFPDGERCLQVRHNEDATSIEIFLP